MKITTVSTCALLGILPLMLLPMLPGMLCIGIVFCLACLLCFLPYKYMRFAGLTLLFFLWGILAAKEAMWAGNTLPAKTQQAIVRITGNDNALRPDHSPSGETNLSCARNRLVRAVFTR